ncbi:winged helix-turn-helix domain-containing protein [Candidatus Enterococcus ferrettii]|uniref:OmpR/PhoB-type domain-containing protein n=1 Tax=Candidatus Enterococcus ferrettii TaxID=2815324 RepID=A0ABV0EVK0_9ENTE|nr:winged helix-turn-helix domain-containing protein [Enterococcus sp. 665A]MBO1342887.1 winged helix-turn-helix domain-containing protein [Enterococcus sp. 665A]
MQHVLILTKNSLTEEPLVQKLQRMNCEILCSTDLFKRLKVGTISPFLSYFQWIILSESLCNSEVEQILQMLRKHPLLVLRVVENIPNEEEQAYWQERGLVDWVTKETSYELLREKINELQQQVKKDVITGNQILTFPTTQGEKTTPNNLEILIKSLSKTEKRVFECLIQSYSTSGVLSRQELCDSLWHDGGTSSNMSQLSCLINKLKHKFEIHGITGETITTLWGRGYKLSSSFYEYWLEGSQQLEELKYYTVTN